VSVVEVVFRREDVVPSRAAGRACAAVDVLRAGTTVACALGAGAAEVWLFREVAAARAARESFAGEALLAGERGGVAPDGFDLGNSPADFTPARVGGRAVFFTTTNGTAALADLAGGSFVAFAALVNAGAVGRALAGRIERHGEDVLVACAGTKGRYSVEDAFCAGLIVRAILDRLPGRAVELADGARIALDFAGVRRDPARVLAEGDHGRTLTSLGLGRDLVACAEADSLDVVPILRLEPLRLVAG